MSDHAPALEPSGRSPEAATAVLLGSGPVAFVHAHPDDETLATGALISYLTRRHRPVAVLTATRGEAGELVPGALPPDTTADQLTEHRETELDAACQALGVQRHDFLGTPPARAAAALDAAGPRRYTDSGMRWVRPGLAGPAADAGPDSLTSAAVDDAAADVAAWLAAVAPDVVLTYDEHGGYGHPDHVRVNEITVAAAARVGIPVVFVVSPALADNAALGPIDWLQLGDELPTVQQALAHHRSQVSVDGADVVHVGGQREPILTRVGLRLAAP
ncbi:PIG-L family deacetylase [Nakamurella aerolata]|uniref:GlcNAc-PI de-N-acetylase n=1 Tax=Nakamurella aerolata TaxID=1656892 RepID=A0A849A842_9ACTN|nr:PIG-L family deacetylase [Nakamurella aerolata]NNG35663.1 GlcNAc-PI de-N-acetylase [Nakamurella aerolata]